MKEIRGPSVKEIQREVRNIVTTLRVGAEILLAVSAPALGIKALSEAINPQSVEAAGPVCDPQRNDYNYTVIIRRVPFFNVGGKEGIFDLRIDPWLEIPVTGSGVKAVEKSSGKVLSERSYTLVRPNVPNFTPKKGEENVAWSVLNWSGNCDSVVNANTPSGKTRTVATKEVLIISTQDEKNETFPVTAADGGYVNMWDGRAYKTAEQFIAAYDQNPALARDLSPQTLQSIREQAKKLTQQTEEQKRIDKLEATVKELQQDKNKGQSSEGSGVTAPKPVDNIQAQLDQIKKDNEEKDKVIEDLKSRVEKPAEGNGISLPNLNLPDLTAFSDNPIVGTIKGAGEFILDLPAKITDRFTDPNAQPPIRWGIDALGWVLLLGRGKFGAPRTAVYRTLRYPRRLWIAWKTHQAAVAGTPAGTPAPAFVRPPWA